MKKLLLILLPVLLFAQADRIVEVDTYTESNALLVIDFEHHKIHEGTHFVTNDQDTLAAAGERDLRLTTPASGYIHLIWATTSNQEITTSIYEGGNVTDGTAKAEINSNRNSLNEAVMVVTHTPVVTTTGALIWQQISGTANKIGGDTRNQAELVLKQDTNYLYRTVATNNGTFVTTLLNWYEVP